MTITLTSGNIHTKDQVIREKEAAGYTLVNIQEGFDTMMSGPDGMSTNLTLSLEFRKF